MPLVRRIPKRGFNNIFRVEWYVLNVSDLKRVFESGLVDVDAMKSAGLVPKKAPRVKILGKGDIDKKLNVKAHAFSASAKEKLEKAGGTVELLSVSEPKKESR